MPHRKTYPPIIMAGGTAKEILICLKRIANYEVSQEQEYVCLKILYKLTEQATLQEFLDACRQDSGMGLTRKQIEIIEPFTNNLSEFTW